MTYLVAELRKPDFQKFTDLIPLEPNRAAIPKTMIFVDKASDGTALVELLKGCLTGRLGAPDEANQIIRPFHSHL